ncbi:hypothetical protein [Fodinibius halophilus]|uniref:Uncharacterized protein n=1 Tax=Fodinibius halophilus TaxID=1736908 RepID=A0A6M1T7A9_9BACT|nr:hypothetical protein [Fodinibius halophilus]NGP90087.1 hypothetical protein [Fodinibius halophilus]
MEIKNKLMVLIASLVLVFGFIYTPTSSVEARASLDICYLNYPDMPDPCTQAPVNCYCDVIVTPEKE